jgi:protein gp37
MANRLKGRFGYPEDEPFRPTFHPDKLQDIYNLPKAHKRVFLNSMSDWFSPGVEPAWIDATMDAVIKRQDHTFIVLTKRPDLINGRLRGLIPPNIWLGVSVTNQTDVWRIEALKKSCPCYPHKFISFEPLHSHIDADLSGIEWVIIGAETGNRKGKIIPETDWVLDLDYQAREKLGIPVFMKNNLIEPCNFGNILQQFPEEMNGRRK